MRNILILLLCSLILASCEKTVDLHYKSNEYRMIIEGSITNEPGPYFVKITKSISLSDAGNYPSIDNAVVTISDNAGSSETLAPQGNGIYRSSSLNGVPGRTYTLTVKAAGQNYTAQSIMPQSVAFDSIKIEHFSFGGDLERNIIPVYRDPVGKGNHYRFLLSINNQLVNQHFVQNDVITDGLINTLRLETDDNLVTLEPGDVVSITMQCIDSKVALYYTTLALMADSGPGGGTTPGNPPSNISNGALGIFSAHNVANKSKVVQ